MIAFGAPQFIDNPEPLRELRDAYRSSHVVGCSSSGEIFGTEVFDGTIAVAVVRFDKGSIAHAFTEVASPSESYQAGEKLARSLLRDDLRGVLVLSDGINVNGTELVRGINAVLATEVVVTGGLAGDAARFQRTWVIRDGTPITGGFP